MITKNYDASKPVTIQSENSDGPADTKPVNTRKACSAKSELLVPSHLYRGFSRSAAPDPALGNRFSSEFDIGSRKILRYRTRSGTQFYEAETVLRLETYDDPGVDSLRKTFSGRPGKYGSPGYANVRTNYRWPAGSYIYDAATGHYRMDMDKFAVYLSTEVTLPEWRHVVRENRDNWNRFFCELLEHEIKHLDIGRTNMLTGLNRTGLLRARSHAELEKSIYATWNDVFAKSRQAQDRFDKTTDHGPRL